jgi:hypothetical protein
MSAAARGTPGTGPDRLPARLRLAPVPHQGPLDGVWWPRTRQPAVELTALVEGLAARGVVATRLSLSVTTWHGTPGRLRVDDRDVRLMWFAYQAAHTAVVRYGSGEMRLLVIPPEAADESAARALRLVSDPDSLAGAEDILTMVASEQV